MSKPNLQKRSVRVDEACEILACSSSLIYELAQRGEIEAFRVGLGQKRGGLRIMAESVDAFILRKCADFRDACAGIPPALPARPANRLPSGKRRSII